MPTRNEHPNHSNNPQQRALIASTAARLMRAAFRGKRLPGLEGIAGQCVLVRQQSDAGCTLGQHRVACAAGGLQVLARRLRQLPRLQGEFTRQAGFHWIDLDHRLLRFGGPHRKRGGEQRSQQQQAWTSVLRDGHGTGRYNDGLGQQLIAGT